MHQIVFPVTQQVANENKEPALPIGKTLLVWYISHPVSLLFSKIIKRDYSCFSLVLLDSFMVEKT